MADTLLPPTSVPAVRIETGTIATSGPSGSASRSWSQVRRAPAVMAMTTSLTETPKAFLTRLTSGSDTEPKAKRRWGEMATLKGV